MQTIKERTKKIVESKLGIAPGDYKDEERFEADLGCDSLDLMDVVMECEKEFEITIPDDAIQKGARVQDLIEYIQDHVEGK